MGDAPRVFLGTVALEINRWGSRVPSFKVSDYLERIKNAGFDGIELWENHAAGDEPEKIKASGFPVSVFNTYAGFGDEDAPAREAAANTANFLNSGAVKYNVGEDASRLNEYKRNVSGFADMLPRSDLLCECHAGTVLEHISASVEFFSGMPTNFGIITHPFGPRAALQNTFEAHGARLKLIHSQFMKDRARVRLDRAPDFIRDCFAVMREHGFAGDFTIEFTELTGAPGENIEALFENAVADMAFIKNNY